LPDAAFSDRIRPDDPCLADTCKSTQGTIGRSVRAVAADQMKDPTELAVGGPRLLASSSTAQVAANCRAAGMDTSAHPTLFEHLTTGSNR
jgi:hypothetical protein